MFLVSSGEPKLGSQVKKDGVNFSIFSKCAQKVVLNIFENESDSVPFFSYKLDDEKNRTGDVWHIFVEGASKNTLYTWQMDGPKNDIYGNIFDFSSNLLDPYCKIFTREEVSDIRKAVVMDDEYLNRVIKRPKTNKKSSIVYEMHIGLFTKSPTSKVNNPGTFKGCLEKISHLKKLGVTAIELLPIFEFRKNIEAINPVTGKNLENVWGYDPISFFALTTQYSSSKKEGISYYEETLKEFIDFVDKVHSEGMEVILDVVYNHTAEGNEHGRVYNFKGMGNPTFYLLENNKKYYMNYSGTGNTINCNHQVVKIMIINSLRYWYSKVGVDGFRFDLGSVLGRGRDGAWLGEWKSLLQDISEDQILSNAKFFTEGWDAGGGYYVDEFPPNFSVWNGRFRDCIRSFIKGDEGVIFEMSQKLQGSPDMLKSKHKSPTNSLNYVTAHDGFTMLDLVSYDNKHNIQNGEKNMDGESNNHSWNHGAEGETPLEFVNELRKKQMRNIQLLLMISQGIPMIYMGDEMGKTQQGNNNAYCQNNELNWIDWDRKTEFEDNFLFLSKLIEFRKKYITAFKMDYKEMEKRITFHGIKENEPDYNYQSHSLAMMIDLDETTKLYVAFNSYYRILEFKLPTFKGGRWRLITDTASKNLDFHLDGGEVIREGRYSVKERSSIIAICKIYS